MNNSKNNKRFTKKINEEFFSGFLTFFDGDNTINWLYSYQYGDDVPINFGEGHEYSNATYFPWIEMLSRFIKRPMQLSIDIGAFTGDTTLPIAKLSKKTIAFECHPTNFRQLEANAKINPSMDIDVFNLAVAHADGIIKIGYPDRNGFESGPNGGAIMFNHYKNIIDQKCIKLDEFLNKNYHGNKVSFIKMDTEGLDMAIINSIQELIARDRPILLLEVFPFYDEFKKFIKESNYSAYYFETGYKIDLNNIKIGDLICIPNEFKNETN